MMARVYAISKVTNLYSDHAVSSILNHYFETIEEAQKYLSELGDEEFGDESFYKLLSESGEIDRRWGEYCEGIYFPFHGKERAIEYQIITLRSYSDYKERTML